MKDMLDQNLIITVDGLVDGEGKIHQTVFKAKRIRTQTIGLDDGCGLVTIVFVDESTKWDVPEDLKSMLVKREHADRKVNGL
jgi:hypothetical protein